MADNVSSLPTAMQQRRAQLENGAAVTPPAQDTPPASPPANTDDGAKITISREEFNTLQAGADARRAAEGRAEALAMDVEALTARLTELERASKGSSTPTNTGGAADSWQPQKVEYTEQENTDYGESKTFIRKVVLEVLNEVLPKFSGSIESKLTDIKGLAEKATSTAASVRSKTYTDKVRDEVGNFDECVNHKHWRDFTASTDPDTGYTYAELIQSNLERENVTGMVRVFNKFKEKYGVGRRSATTGYEGGIPTGDGGGSEIPPEPQKTRLPFSKRKEAHRKFINKEISFEEYQKVQKQYEEADREGLVDYNK